MKTLLIPLHSFVDVITNSSSEVYVTSDRATITAVKQMVDAVLKAGGSKKTCDELVNISLVSVDGGYGHYKAISVTPRGENTDEAARLIEALQNAFQAETISNE
jgi:hypothetical protein